MEKELIVLLKNREAMPQLRDLGRITWESELIPAMAVVCTPEQAAAIRQMPEVLSANNPLIGTMGGGMTLNQRGELSRMDRAGSRISGVQ